MLSPYYKNNPAKRPICVFLFPWFSLFFLCTPLLSKVQISPEIEFILRIEENYKENCPDTHYQLKQLAKQNNRIACRLVGLNHLSGNGASKNGDIAMRWLERAAQLGDMESLNLLLSYYSKNTDTYQLALWQKVRASLYQNCLGRCRIF